MTSIDAIWLFSVLMENNSATLWLSTTSHPPPIELLAVLATPMKNYLKWQANQLSVSSAISA